MYQPGTKMHVSDALSGLTDHNDNSKANAIPGLDISVHDVKVFTEMSVLSLAKIKKVTEAEPDLKTLKQCINDGFPENKADCLESLRGYFNFREELAIIDGLILKGHWCVIPSALHDEALKLLHHSHMGIVKTKDRARTSFFWPNLNWDIEVCLSKCHTCATYQEKQPAESLLNDPASTKPWTALVMDNFELNGRHYLIIVDCFSKFTVVKHSQDLTSKTTINQLLEVFSEHGIPSTIRCDHGCNFISSQFIEFCKQLNIAVTLSLGYHHSSKPAKWAIKTVKSLMKRCLAANTSWHIALLEYLSSPLGANIPSPSELIGRQFRGLLPLFQDCSTSESIKEQVLILKEKEKQRHNTSAYDLSVIPVGATVSYLNNWQSWKPHTKVLCNPHRR